MKEGRETKQDLVFAREAEEPGTGREGKSVEGIDEVAMESLVVLFNRIEASSLTLSQPLPELSKNVSNFRSRKEQIIEKEMKMKILVGLRLK